MSEGAPVFPSAPSSDESLISQPIIILTISIAVYLVLFVIIVMVRQCLLQRGFCAECFLCGKENEPTCLNCCAILSESCQCNIPSIESCLDTCCPKRKQMDCVDIILCQCCAGADYGNICNFGNCKCDCGCDPGCNQINCLCFQLNFMDETTQMAEAISSRPMIT